MHRTAATAAALGALALALGACGGSKSDSSSDSASTTTTAAASPGGSGSGATKGGVDITIAAAGSIPETHISSEAAPAGCTLTDARSISVDLMPGSSIDGLTGADFVSLSSGFTKLTISGQAGMGEGSLSDHVTLKPTGSSTTATLDAFPISIGDTKTTMSGTVTCPKG